MNDFLWPYLEQVFKLERRATTLKTGTIQEHTVYGFTSLSREEIEPKDLLDTIRSYWGIENGLHYRRDVTLKEGRIRMTKGKAGQVMACLDNLVFIGKQKFRYLPDARRLFAAQPDQAFALISRL